VRKGLSKIYDIYMDNLSVYKLWRLNACA